MEQLDPRWRKASYSGEGANCVEAGHVPGAVLIRDTKDRERGPVLRVSPEAWSTFMGKIKAGK
jgi:3-mercaptopyruvate sulfurtransferase SseA